MNIINLIIGILLILGSIIYFIDVLKEIEKDEDYSQVLASFDIQIIGGTFIFFLIGIVMVYKEVKFLL